MAANDNTTGGTSTNAENIRAQTMASATEDASLERLIGREVLRAGKAVITFTRKHLYKFVVGGVVTSVAGASVWGSSREEQFIGYKKSPSDFGCEVRISDTKLRALLADPLSYRKSHEKHLWNIKTHGREFRGVVAEADDKSGTKKADVLGFREDGVFFDAARNGKIGRAVWHLKTNRSQDYFIGYQLAEECNVGKAVLLCPYVLVAAGKPFDASSRPLKNSPLDAAVRT